MMVKRSMLFDLPAILRRPSFEVHADVDGRIMTEWAGAGETPVRIETIVLIEYLK